MSMKSRFGFRLSGNKVMFFFNVDCPLYDKQLDMVWQDINAQANIILQKPRSKNAQLLKKWYDSLNGISHDGYGSFRMDFDGDIWDFDDKMLEKFSEQINEMFCETQFAMNKCITDEIENDIECLLENHTPHELLQLYINLVLENGYKVSQSDVADIFENHLDSQVIANEFLARKLRDENVKIMEPA